MELGGGLVEGRRVGLRGVGLDWAKLGEAGCETEVLIGGVEIYAYRCIISAFVPTVPSPIAYLNCLGQNEMEAENGIPRSRLSAALPIGPLCGCTLGPTLSPAGGCGGCAPVRFEEGGSGRVGYLRGVVEETFEAVFAAEEVNLEEAEPIFALGLHNLVWSGKLARKSE